MRLLVVVGGCAFRRHGSGCMIKIEQTEGGFSGIVFHGLMRQCDFAGDIFHRHCLLLGRKFGRRRRCGRRS